MRHLTVSLSICISIVLLASISFAQQTASTTVPNLIRYGGSLKDVQGAPAASATLGVTFAIYRQQDGGAPIWMETQNVTTDASGNYSVLLGSTTAHGLPDDLFSQQEQRWLGVQAQGEAEQPRVLLVSVPYALKAHEAETLGGRTVSDFVLANGTGSSANNSNAAQIGGATLNNPAGEAAGVLRGAASQGPTNFTGSTTDQIIGVTQTGTGVGINVTSPGNGVVGTSTAGSNYGVWGQALGVGGFGILGTANSSTGAAIGVKGSSTSPSGTGVRGIETATTGGTAGVSGYVASTAGTAGSFNNAAGGKILSGQNNGEEKFSVDGSGNVTSSGAFTGSGSGLTGITFSHLTGTLGNTQLSGSYSNAVTLSNSGNSFTGSGAALTGIPFSHLTGILASTQLGGTYSGAVTLSSNSNSFTGNGAALTGVLPAAGSANYIQNTMSPQHGTANFNITGNGVLSGTLVANAGVSGVSTIATGNAVSGMATVTSGTANGVYGQSASSGGAGVYGKNTSTTGLNYGVWGQTASTTNNASGVYGVANGATGNTNGVYGLNNSSTNNASGVYGVASPGSGSTNGVFGLTNSSDGNADGVYGKASSTSGGANGVTGVTESPHGYGVWGVAASTDTSGYGYGVYGTSANGVGVYGSAQSSSVCAAGVVAYSASPCSDGVYAVDTATSGNANGLYAQTNSSQGVAGFFNNGGGGYILVGIVNGAPQHMFDVDGSGNGSYAGSVQVAGDLNVSGTLSKGGGSFKIDDPLDPENKYLSHSFVESPDMMNIYNGIIRLDAHGEAWVDLPDYFEALNRDFRYQLTSIGASQPRLYIAREVKGNRFKIAGGKANAKVSWQLTGIRQDAWANAHRIPVEEQKPADMRGKYLHPDVYPTGAKNTNAMLQH